MRSSMYQPALLILLLGLALIWSPQAATAQTINAWFPKFVCGFEPGNVRLLNDASPVNQGYEDFKPGNYATAVNIVNTGLASETVVINAMLTARPPGVPAGGSIPIGTRTLSGLVLSPPGAASNVRIDCTDIANALGALAPPGTLIEGNFFIVAASGRPVLQVDSVYTYSSQNAFERHLILDITQSPVGGQFTRSVMERQSRSLLNLIAPLNIPSRTALETGGSGAGGLGLGASIDVERCPAVEIDLGTADTDMQGLLEKLGH